jgi:hypothetical protein
MGYRSEVAYQIVLKDKKLLNEFIAQIMVLGGYERKALEECQIETSTHAEECFINFYANDVKWYDGYPDVQGHEKLRELALEWFNHADVGVNFIRIGEELEDIVEEYEGELADWTELRVNRSIDIPFDHEYIAIGNNLRVLDNNTPKLDISSKV